MDTVVAFGHRGPLLPPGDRRRRHRGHQGPVRHPGQGGLLPAPGGRPPPRPLVADLEEELLALGNRTMLGIMGFRSDTPVLDVHCEVAYTHTGGLPVGISELCHAVRRATARVHGDGRVEYREDPQWFTPYSRREGVDAGGRTSRPRRRKGGEGMKGLSLGRGHAIRRTSVGIGRAIPLIEVRQPAPSPALRRDARPAQGAGVGAAPAREAREVHLTVPLSRGGRRAGCRSGTSSTSAGASSPPGTASTSTCWTTATRPPSTSATPTTSPPSPPRPGRRWRPGGTGSTPCRPPPASATPSGWSACWPATACGP